MSFTEFCQKYNTEKKCILLLKEFRDKYGVYCNRCGYNEHYWLPSRQRYRCKRCARETTIRSGTALEYSKLPVHYWIYAIGIMSFQMKSVSALQMQRTLGHPYYRPIWLMMQKLKVMMADRVEWYGMLDHLMAGTAEVPAVREQPARNVGLQDRGPSKLPELLEKGFRVDNRSRLQTTRIELHGLNLKLPESHIWAGRAKGSRLRLISMKEEERAGYFVSRYHPVQRQTTPHSPTMFPRGMNIRIRSKELRPQPWFINDPERGKLRYIQIMLVNARRSLVGIHHYVSARYLRNYLGEFCYLTNRRYSREEKLEHLFRLFVSKAWNLPYIVDASD